MLLFLLRSHLPRLTAFPTAGAGNRELLASAGGGGQGAGAGGGGDEASLSNERSAGAELSLEHRLPGPVESDLTCTPGDLSKAT